MAELTTTLPQKRALAVSRRALLTALALTLIVLFHVGGSLFWIARNVAIYGRDAGGHLTRTLQYAEALQPLTWQSLFRAVTLHDFRPPLLYLAAQVPYGLVGTSADAAQAVNVFFLAASLLLTFAIARHLLDERGALLATFLAGLVPLVAMMARLFYLDIALTCFVLLTLLALLRSDGFASRRWALVWGLSVGLGLLVKWSLPAFVFLPTLIVVARGGLVRAQGAALRRPRVAGRALLVAGMGALALAALWYVPSRDYARTLPLGDGLLLVWVALLLPLLYALQRPRRPLPNFWAGALLALFVASLWYAARIGFASQLADATYGTYGGNYGALDVRNLRNYTRTFGYLVFYLLGPLAAVLILPAALWPWLRRWRGWRAARPAAWLLWGSLASTYLFLSFSSQDGERNLVPLMPVLAILAVDSLQRYGRRVAWGLGAAWVAVLLLHWSLFTFDGLGPLQQRSAALWARGEFLQRPASGQTAPGFWIAPDVLRTIAGEHDPRHGPQAIFGMLINASEIHRGPYHYLIDTTYPQVDLIALTEEQPDMWVKTVQSEWVLSKDGDNHELDPAALRALAQVYERPDGLFPLLFQPRKRYALPNGETATLWRRTVGQRHLPQPDPALLPLADLLRAWQRDQPLLLSGREQALALGLLDLTPSPAALMAGARPDAPTLFLLRHRGEASDAATMAWIEEHFFPAQDGWFGAEYLTVWGRPTQPMVSVPATVALGGATVAGLRTVEAVEAGNVAPLEVAWALGGQPLKGSFRLLDGSGQPVAQLDRDLAAAMRLGLFVPPETTPGPYTLAVSVYDPATLAPLPNDEGETLLPLATIQVR